MEIYSKTLAKKITDYLDSEDFRYNFLEEDGVIAFSFNMDGLGQLNYLIRLLDSAYLVEVFQNNMQLVQHQFVDQLILEIQ